MFTIFWLCLIAYKFETKRSLAMTQSPFYTRKFVSFSFFSLTIPTGFFVPLCLYAIQLAPVVDVRFGVEVWEWRRCSTNCLEGFSCPTQDTYRVGCALLAPASERWGTKKWCGSRGGSYTFGLALEAFLDKIGAPGNDNGVYNELDGAPISFSFLFFFILTLFQISQLKIRGI